MRPLITALVMLVICIGNLYAQTLTLVGDECTPTQAAGVDIVCSCAYLANHEDTRDFYVIDVSNPSNPSVLGSMTISTDVWDFEVSGSYAYIAGDFPGVFVLDVSDPANPCEVGNCEPGALVSDVALSGNHVFAPNGQGAGGINQLTVVNIEEPTDPTIVANLAVENGHPWGIDIVDSLAYVVDVYRGLLVIDISDPLEPALLGVCSLPLALAILCDLDVSGDYAYVANAYSGLRVIDITDPTDPHEVGYCITPGDARDVAVYGEYAFVASGAYVAVVDVSDPANAQLLCSCQSSGWTGGIDVVYPYVYVGANSGGLEIYEFDPMDHTDPTWIEGTAITVRNSPNPFKSRTTIRYQLPAPDYMTLKIYNITGQLVRTLLDDPMKSGYHSTVWNGRNNKDDEIGSGLYFICLQIGNFTVTKKTVVLK